MNLALDFGNSYVKAGLFDKDSLVKVIERIALSEIHDLLVEHMPEKIIVSTVSTRADDIKPYVEGFEVTFLSAQLPLPYTIDYKTPATLGLDRIAGVAGAQGLFPQRSCLVIDAGTCITYDIIDKDGVYYGGGIAPGMNMRFKALHNFTANLPLVEFEENIKLVGQSTKESILSGVIYGTLAEIQEIIRMYSDKFRDLQIIMCGGDAKFFENKLKASIFVAPELVLRGLNRILLYNA